jgi:tetratricopeptide (TPR) repeat protein
MSVCERRAGWTSFPSRPFRYSIDKGRRSSPYVMRYTARVLGWSTAAEDTLSAQLDLLTKATAINPGYARAHYVKSLVVFHKQLSEAIEAARMAVSLDPNAAYGYFALGHAEAALGRCQQSNEHIKQAFVLSPRDPGSGFWHMDLGVSEVCLGRVDAGIAEFRRALDEEYRTFVVYAFLAGAEAAKGNDVEAKLALAEARRLNPQFTIKWFVDNLPLPWPTIVDGWRKAGLPEE